MITSRHFNNLLTNATGYTFDVRAYLSYQDFFDAVPSQDVDFFLAKAGTTACMQSEFNTGKFDCG